MTFITREENYRRTHYVSLILEQHTTFSIFLNFAGNVARVLATGGVSLICEQVCKTKWMVFDIAKLNLKFCTREHPQLLSWTTMTKYASEKVESL